MTGPAAVRAAGHQVAHRFRGRPHRSGDEFRQHAAPGVQGAGVRAALQASLHQLGNAVADEAVNCMRRNAGKS